MVNPLARVVMKNVVNKAKVDNSNNPGKSINNLSTKEMDLISDVIRGDKKIKEEKYKEKMITLDEAAKRVRSSPKEEG